MRRGRELFHSRPFRMAGLYAGVFALLSALSLGLMFTLYRRELSRELEAALQREADNLVEAWQAEGVEGVRRYADTLRLQPLGERWRVELRTPDATLRVPQPSAPGTGIVAPERLTRSFELAPGVSARLQVSTQAQREAVRLLGRALASGVVGLVLLALAGGMLLAWLTNRRVSQMDRALAAIMQGDLSSRLPVRERGDELDRLAANVNLALDRVQQLMETVRSATDGIAHDLRTPLARHRARLEQAQAQPPDAAEFDAWIQDALGEVDRILATFRGLLQLATVETGVLRSRFTTVDLAEIAADMVELFEPLAGERGLVLHAALPPQAPVSGLRDLLGQSIANLLDNAIKFSPAGACIVLRLHPGPTVVLSIEDQGPGIPEGERERVFQRLYRLDSSRNTPGLGLGLSLARAVVELHGGRITVQAKAPGTRVVLTLPAA